MTPTLERITGERRSTGSIQIIALYITILVNVVAIVWGAATLNAEVRTLQTTVSVLVPEVEDIKIIQAIQHDRELRGKGKP